jgi:hypothetical protein
MHTCMYEYSCIHIYIDDEGTCTTSLALQTALEFGITRSIISRAEILGQDFDRIFRSRTAQDDQSISEVNGFENMEKADIIAVIKEDKKMLKEEGAEDVQISTLLEAHRSIYVIYVLFIIHVHNI